MINNRDAVKALLSPRGPYLISGLIYGGLIREGLLYRGGGGVFQILKYCFCLKQDVLL